MKLQARSAGIAVTQCVAWFLFGAEAGDPRHREAVAGTGAMQVPLSFVENRGQWDADISFAAYRLGASAVIGREGIEFIAGDRSDGVQGRVGLLFEGTVGAIPCGEDPVETAYHFVAGSPGAARRPGVKGYASLLYESLYPGISLRVRASAAVESFAVLAYDVLLEPGASVGTVSVRCDGIEQMEVLGDGLLVLTTGDLAVRQAPPVAWQELPTGERRFVDARFRILDDHRFGFEVADWDPMLPGVIDPTVQFGTHLGGSGEDFAFDTLADDAGNFVAVGFGTSIGTLGGRHDAFVAMFDAELENLRALTILGGRGDDRALVVQPLAGGKVLVGGATTSNDFPTSDGAPDKRFSGVWDGFVTVLDPLRGSIAFSTYVGGQADDCVTSLAVDADGRALVAGHTFSADVATWFDPPAAAGFQMTPAGNGDSFLCRLDLRQIGQAVVPVDYFTLLGGAGRDCWYGEYFDESRIELHRNVPKIALLPDGTVAIAGVTTSSDFPRTATGFQQSFRGAEDGFVARIQPDAALPAEEQLLYATYLGGASTDFALSVAADPSGDVWLTGFTWSTGFPVTPNAIQRNLRAEDDVFVTRVRPDPGLSPQDQLVYSTFFGGTTWEWGHDIEVGPGGSVTVVGHSESTDLRLSEPAKSFGLILHLKPVEGGSDMEIGYAALIGAGDTELTGVRIMPGGQYAIAGYASGTVGNFPPGGYQPVSGGAYDAIVLAAEFRLPLPQLTVTPASGRVPLEVAVDAGTSESYEGTLITGYHWDFGDGSTADGVQAVHTYTVPGSHVLTLTVTTDIGSQNWTTAAVHAWCNLANDIAPWSAADVGTPRIRGSASRDGDALSVCAGGRTIAAATGEEFCLVYQEMTGDFAIALTVPESTDMRTNCRIGLEARESLEPLSRFAAIVLETHASGLRHRFRFRDSVDLYARSLPNTTLPESMLLVRRGDDFLAWTWPVGERPGAPLHQEHIPGLPATLLVGMGVCGGDLGDETRPFVPLSARVVLDFTTVPIAFARGDANTGDGVDVADAVFVLGYLFAREAAPTCLDAADANDSGEIDIADAITILSHLFASAGPLPAPFGQCGFDPTADDLECGSFPPCEAR